MKPLGSVNAVVASIREDAQAEAQRLEREAEEQAAAVVQESASAPTARREDRLAVARRLARERLAREDWADARAVIEAREAWIRKVVAAGNELLALRAPPIAGGPSAEAGMEAVDVVEDPSATADERRSLLLRLAREAIAGLPPGAVTLLVAPLDLPLIDAEACAALGPKVTAQADPLVSSGCIARSADGRATFDNTLADRARRFETAWRAALAKVVAT